MLLFNMHVHDKYCILNINPNKVSNNVRVIQVKDKHFNKIGFSGQWSFYTVSLHDQGREFQVFMSSKLYHNNIGRLCGYESRLGKLGG